jgi:hypothetical protein
VNHIRPSGPAAMLNEFVPLGTAHSVRTPCTDIRPM